MEKHLQCKINLICQLDSVITARDATKSYECIYLQEAQGARAEATDLYI